MQTELPSSSLSSSPTFFLLLNPKNPKTLTFNNVLFFLFPSQPLNSDDEIYPPDSPTATVVKSDFSLITQTIDRQLQNLASFLAPPPQKPYSPSSTPPVPLPSDVSPSSYGGLKNDLTEIGDRFKTGLSLLSPKKAVTEISKFASNLLQIDKGDDVKEVGFVGITDDILDFV